MTLKILQWNVWYKEKADSVLNFIKENDPDILCLQELTQDSKVNPSRNIVAEICSLGYETYYKLTIDRHREKMGNGIFSKYPIVNQKNVYVQREDPESFSYSKENRIYIETELNIHNKRFTVGTVHLSYAHSFVNSTQKQVEAAIVVDAIKEHSSSYLLAGDFNSTPQSPIIQLFSKNLVYAGPDPLQATWTTKPFSYNGFHADSLSWRLDHVFTTTDINVVSSEIIQTDISDHLPILTTVDL